MATQFDTEGVNAARGPVLAATEIAAAARQCGVAPTHAEPRLGAALQDAARMSAPDNPVVVSGSFFAVADAGELIT